MSRPRAARLARRHARHRGRPRGAENLALPPKEISVRAFQLGDTVVRSNRLLKTVGEVLRITNATCDGVRLLRITWFHPTTVPKPSRALEDQLDRAAIERPRASHR